MSIQEWAPILGGAAIGAIVTSAASIGIAIFNAKRRDGERAADLLDRKEERRLAADQRKDDRSNALADREDERKHTRAVLEDERQHDAKRQAAERANEALRDTLTMLRTIRVNYAERSEGVVVPYADYIKAADTALLIPERAFAEYLSLDILNLQGLPILGRSLGEEHKTSAAQWEHLSDLVKRCTDYAVDGSWDSAWLETARKLAKDIDDAWEEMGP
ncbi:predicted membrane protein [Microbacterium testaceum StLB037]|uniref:Predicted membrane protein n=1 Tax=Microbacterium testaceum (strain StLB037) TaxID=979556 RepID=E8NBD9_MICTS|nr:hypothetical protein [Microbacterium testaceum]BAJ75996.1 predicted membrane protein [Microbacterium testaceum StLB037]